MIVGGPPCQGFSALGKQDVNDDRNSLWKQYAKVIERSKPKYFIVENVVQFLTSSQFSDFQSLTSRGQSLEDYELTASVLNAAMYGVPQTRKRAVVIGRHRDMPNIGLPDPTSPDRANWSTVRQAWVGLPLRVTHTDLPDHITAFEGESLRGEFKTTELHVTRNYEPLSIARFGHIPSGGNRFDIPDDLLSDCWRKHKTGAGDVMGRLDWDRPSVTIRTEFFKPEKGRYLHPSEHRAITHHEAARLQGFNDDYRWCGSKTQIARQIGNAVPIPLAAELGRHIAEAL